MRIYKYFIILITIFILSCQDNSQTLKIGTNVWPGYEPIYIAREKGFLNSKKIKLIEFGSASQVIRAYRRNLINSAGLTLDEVIFLKSTGFDPKIVLIADISNGADVLIVKPYIKTLQDLKGKRIGVENTALGAFFLSRILEFARLKETDIKIIPLEVNEHYKAFIESKVDGVITFEPVRTKLLHAGGKILFDSSKIKGEIVDVFVVEDLYLKNNEDIVKQFVESWFKGLKFLHENEKEALKVISEREKISTADLKKAYQGLILPDKDENLEIMQNKLKDVILKLVKIMKNKKLIPEETNFNPDELIEIKFVKGIE